MASSRITRNLAALSDERDDDFGAARVEGRLRREAKERDRERRQVFEEGRREGRRRARAARAPRRRRRTLAREVASVVPEVRVAGRQGMRVVVMVLGLTLLYLVLDPRSVGTVSGALGGLRRALDWLRSPTAVIPAKET